MRSIEELKQANREITEVPTHLLRTDGGTQYRDGIDDETMREYLDAMREGAVFPPIEAVFDGLHHWVVDGFHRLAAFSRLGSPAIKVFFLHGSVDEARLLALGANAHHGLRRDAKTKRRIVQEALQHPALKDASNYTIAKHCGVSAPFVAAVRSPEIRKRQDENRVKSAKKVLESDSTPEHVETIPAAKASEIEVNAPNDYAAPSREEIEAAEEAFKADQDMMYKMLESDDALQVAVEENKRLNLRVAQLETRLRGLMNERNECVKMIKSRGREIERLRRDLQVYKPTRSEIAINVEVAARQKLLDTLRDAASA